VQVRVYNTVENINVIKPTTHERHIDPTLKITEIAHNLYQKKRVFDLLLLLEGEREQALVLHLRRLITLLSGEFQKNREQVEITSIK
jgi:hypothetical protein